MGKYSGLANAKTVGIEPTEKGIVLTWESRKSDRIRKPSKLFNKVALVNKPFRKIAKTIISQTSGNFYRADLQHAALAKWHPPQGAEALAEPGAQEVWQEVEPPSVS